jgi:GTP pyrophosphokinase
LARLQIEERPRLDQICSRYNFHRGEDLLAAIGRGEVAVGQVARLVGEPRTEERRERAAPKVPAPVKREAKGHSEVIVDGVEDLMTHMAQCCKPVPYDEILGFITRGRGVTVHRRDCTNLLKLPVQERARLIDVRWADQVLEIAYPVDLLVIAADRKGLLRDVSSVFSDEGIDVIGVNTASDRGTERATMRFTAEVKDISELEHVLVKLRQIPDVLEVRRPH